MDYPLHYTTTTTEENNHNNNNNTATTSSNNYRSFGVFHDRSDIPSMIFDHNSSPTIDPSEVNNNSNEDRRRSSNHDMVILSTRPPHSTSTSNSQHLHDLWGNQHYHNHHQQHVHSSLNNTFNPNDIHSSLTTHSTHLSHNTMAHSERGIAGFVSKLYQ